MITQEALQTVFLDYLNDDCITLDEFAIDYGMTREEAVLLIKLGRLIHERIAEEHGGGGND